MKGRINYMRGYFYYVGMFFIILVFNIFPQDNTNNMMQEKTNNSTNDLEQKIEQNANYYTNNLKTILNLTDSQMRYIYDIMVNYYLNESGNQTSQRAALRDSYRYDRTNTQTGDNNEDSYINTSDRENKKIENILDNEQIGKWSEIKDSWWVNVKTELYKSDQDVKLNRIIYESKGEYEDDRDYENYDVYYPGYDYK